KLSEAIKADVHVVDDTTRSIKDDTTFLHDDIPILQGDVTALRDDQSLQRHKETMDWLSPTDFPAQQHGIITRRQEGTGEWFLKSAQYTSWVQRQDKTLFCPGIPGAGKTMMAVIAMNDLCRSTPSDKVGVAYVYLLPACRTPQAAGAGPADDCRACDPTIFAALQAVYATYTAVYIVVDALDEGSDLNGERSRLLVELRALQERPDKRNAKKATSMLEKLLEESAALEEAYGDAIKQIDGQLGEDRLLARLVLSWMMYVQRLPTTGELCHALAVEAGDKELDDDNIPDIGDVVSVCAGLVTVDDQSKITHLLHHITQEYFERIRLTWNPGAQEEIASTCLTYLLLETFASGSCASDDDFERRSEKYVFPDYVA
ncbi:hypothetical protein LTS18_012024, partial [Coniosporium uncinatum]